MWFKIAKQVVSFPYHSTSGEIIDKIIEEGFQGDDFVDYFYEYFCEFYADLSPESQKEFDKDYEKFFYSNANFEGKEFDAAVEKLKELWFEDHPNANIIWATDEPNTDYLEFSDPGIIEFEESKEFRPLLDDNYGTGYIYEGKPGNIPGHLFKKHKMKKEHVPEWLGSGYPLIMDTTK